MEDRYNNLFIRFAAVLSSSTTTDAEMEGITYSLTDLESDDDTFKKNNVKNEYRRAWPARTVVKPARKNTPAIVMYMPMNVVKVWIVDEIPASTEDCG